MYNRRDFIKKTFRTVSFAVLAGGGGYLLLREQSDEVCDFKFVCKNCKKLKKCNLPEAKEYENKLKR